MSDTAEKTKAQVLLELAERCEKATGPDRDLDADIAEQAFDWKRFQVGADVSGENNCSVLTPHGGPICDGFAYPPKGPVHRAYHVPEYTRDTRDAAVPRDYVRQQTASALRYRAAMEPSK
jgi:hypothetical protein